MGEAMEQEGPKAVIGVIAKDETQEGLSSVKRSVQDTAQTVVKAGQEASKGISQIGAGADQTARKLESFEKSWVNSVQRALVATEAGEKGTAKYFEAWGKYRGIGGDVMEPILAQLRAAEAAQEAASASMGKMGMSAKATAAAMRGVPAQLSDIFVSIQGGMPLLTVFTQQGLQLRDMFGGFGAAGKALATTVVGMVNPLTVAGAAAVAVGAAYHQGSKEIDALRVSLVATGNFMGASAAQLRQFAAEMGAIGGNEAKASSALADFVDAGVRGTTMLKEYAQTAIDWEKATGTSVGKTAKAFASLQDEPLKAAMDLQKGMNFLTVATYEQATALEEQGRKTEATALLQREYAKALNQGSSEIRDNLGTLERTWDKLGKTASTVWNLMLGVGRSATLADKIGGLREDISNAERQLAAGTGFSETAGGAATGRGGRLTQKDIELLQQRLALNKQNLAVLEEEARQDQVKAERKAEEGRRVSALDEWNQRELKYLSDAKKLERELEQERQLGRRAGLDEEEINKRLNAMREEAAKKDKEGAKAAKAYNKELEDQKKLMAELAGLSSTFYSDWDRLTKMYQQGRITLSDLEKEQAKLLAKQPFAIAQAKEEERVSQARVKAWNEEVKAQEKLLEERQRAAAQVEETLKKAKDEEEAHILAAAAGITHAEALAKIALARAEDSYQQALSRQADGETLLALQKEIEARKQLQEVMRQKGVREANKKAADDAAKDWDKTAQTISRTLSDYIMAGGKNAAQYLKRLFATLVLEPVVQTSVGSLLGVSKSSSGSELNALSTVSRLSSLFGGGTTAGASITSLGYANAVGLAGGDAIGALAAANAQWAGVATGAQAAAQAAVAANAALEAGTAVALEAGTLATAGGAAGAGGLSAALGAIPGWGWALAGGALLLGSMDFGSRGANHTGGAYSTSTSDRNAAASQALGSDAWGNALGDITQRANTALDAQLGKTVDALSGVYTSLAKYAGDSARQIDIAAAFAVNPAHGDEDNYGYFRLIDKITGEAMSTYKARDGVLGTDPKVAYEKFVGEMGGALIAQLKAADIPGWMRSIFDDVGDVVTVDGLNKALTAIAAVDSAFKGWADTLKGFASLSAEAQTSLIKTSGGIDALAGNVNAFYSGFYSEAERMGILQRQVLQQLASLDVSVDTSSADAAKESFRKTVEGALDAGNAELAAKLLAMSGSFATAADYAANAAEQAVQAASQAMESLLKDRRQLEAELLKAQGNTSGYAAAMRAIATEGYTPAEIAAYDYNEALRDQIDAMTAATAAAERAASERTGLETRLLTLQGDTAALRQRELAALDASNRALQEHIWAIEDAQAAYTAATTAAQGAYSGLERSVGAQKSVLQEQYNAQKAALQQQANAAKEAWQAQVSAAQTAASEMRSIASMLGNAFDNVQIQSPALSMARLQSAQSLIIGARDRNDVRVAGLDEALQVASSDSAKLYGKWEEWAFQQGVTAAAVGDLYGEAQKQLSAQEQLIAQLQASDVVAKAISDAEMAKADAWYQQELGVLDATLKTGKDQLNALLGIDDSVLSVADAVAKLGLSINAAEAARQSAEAARAASAAYASASGGGGGGSGAAGPAVSYTDEQLRAMGLDPAAVNAQYNWLKSNGATNAVGPGELVQSMLTSGQAALQGILNTQTNTDKFGNVYKDYADFLGKFTDAQIIQASKIATLPDGVNREEYLRDILAKSINGSHADGLSYVPFDGYIAELHKGERVMTADENRLYTPNFAAVNSGSGVIESLRAEIATLRTLLAEISANTNATAGWTAATDRKLNRVVRNDAIATITT